MKVSIFGLGYVGCVSIACLSKSGHEVIGFDIDKNKVDKISNGIPTIVEKYVSEYIVENKERIQATTDSTKAVEESEISVPYLCWNSWNHRWTPRSFIYL